MEKTISQISAIPATITMEKTISQISAIPTTEKTISQPKLKHFMVTGGAGYIGSHATALIPMNGRQFHN